MSNVILNNCGVSTFIKVHHFASAPVRNDAHFSC